MRFTGTLVAGLLSLSVGISAKRTSRISADKIPGGTDLVYCPDYERAITVEKVSFFEHERKGYLNITGTSEYNIDGEAGYSFVATLGTYSVYDQDELCSKGGLNCPIHKGKFEATYHVPKLGSFSPYLFNIDVRFWDNDNEPLLCLQGKFGSKKSGMDNNEKLLVQNEEHWEM